MEFTTSFKGYYFASVIAKRHEMSICDIDIKMERAYNKGEMEIIVNNETIALKDEYFQVVKER